MIQTFLVKIIIKRIFKAIQRKKEWRRIDEYVNKPNELDIQIKQLQKNQDKILKAQERIEKQLANLKAKEKQNGRMDNK